jgi:hypothetical protein
MINPASGFWQIFGPPGPPGGPGSPGHGPGSNNNAKSGSKSKIPGRVLTSFRGPFSLSRVWCLEVGLPILFSVIDGALFKPGPLVTVPGPTLAENRPQSDQN